MAVEAYRAKTKTPFEFVVSALRAADVDVLRAAPIVQQLQELGMPLYQCQPPTGYRDMADAWTNAGALFARMNFAQTLADRPFATFATGGPAPSLDGRIVGELSDATRATIAKAATPAQRVALTLGSPEFQKR